MVLSGKYGLTTPTTERNLGWSRLVVSLGLVADRVQVIEGFSTFCATTRKRNAIQGV